jgi:hypothetical protein
MSKERNLCDIIEKLEAFEERLGVRIEAHSAWCESHYDEYELFVGGELHAENGNTLKQSITVVADAYNSSNQLLATESHLIDSLTLLGFETFMIWIQRLPHDKIAKIRVYPKPA